MKKLLFAILFVGIAVLITGCPELQIKTENVYHINVVDDQAPVVKSYDITCVSNLDYSSEGMNKGVITDNKCIAFIKTPKGTYKCSLAFGTNGLPINKNTTISESCEIDVAVSGAFYIPSPESCMTQG